MVRARYNGCPLQFLTGVRQRSLPVSGRGRALVGVGFGGPFGHRGCLSRGFRGLQGLGALLGLAPGAVAAPWFLLGAFLSQ